MEMAGNKTLYLLAILVFSQRYEKLVNGGASQSIFKTAIGSPRQNQWSSYDELLNLKLSSKRSTAAIAQKPVEN